MKLHLLTVLVVIVAVFATVGGTATSAHAGTISRAQAVGEAKDYLHSSAFSRKGLIEQLEYEGFSHGDSVYGASHAGANWMVQAVKSAKEYLRSSHFSAHSLFEQLVYEGFTAAQAWHGVHAVGL